VKSEFDPGETVVGQIIVGARLIILACDDYKGSRSSSVAIAPFRIELGSFQLDCDCRPSNRQAAGATMPLARQQFESRISSISKSYDHSFWIVILIKQTANEHDIGTAFSKHASFSSIWKQLHIWR